jgi:flagellar biosynthesis protein FlhB
LEELNNGKGKLPEASEEGQGPRSAVEPMMVVMNSPVLLLIYVTPRFTNGVHKTLSSAN